jgi:hypothetical protein
MAVFLRQVYPIAADANDSIRKRHDRRVESIITRMMRERDYTGRPQLGMRLATAWEAYNAVQGYVQHDATRKGRPNMQNRIDLAFGDRAVAKAMELALAS